jgi:pterin-4a-carbinolamine dehydratase
MTEMMITRAFLLLLAMMTGLSAAQAAEAARPVQEASGVSSLIAGQVSPDLVRATKTQISSHIASFSTAFSFVASIDDSVERLAHLPAVSKTYRSDRARE